MRTFIKPSYSLLSLFFLGFQIFILGQPAGNLSSSEIKLALEKLNTIGSVLYIAAHPDDENTAVLSYLSKEKKIRTGYLSLTRGDGGQNLIGSEQSDLLGLIRTQELIAARKIDGAEQFFTRAVDFGYSKSPEETFEIWGKEKILSDVVWVIRKFRPDVIITRFPPTGEGGHGHHTASAILALEAFKLAGDKNSFPEQLSDVAIWQPKRIFWNAWLPALVNRGIDTTGILKLNLGEYNSLLGKSYTEISALSRTMHKSQGFGSSGWRANLLNYFLQLDGDKAFTGLFEGIDFSWNRIKGGNEIKNRIQQINDNYDFENPQKSLPSLLEIYELISDLDDSYWKKIKQKEILEIIRSCSAIWFEVTSDFQTVAAGDSLNIKVLLVPRSDYPINLVEVELPYFNISKSIGSSFEKGESQNFEFKILIPETTRVSQPYWLELKKENGSFNLSEQKLLANAFNESDLSVQVKIRIGEKTLSYNSQVYYKENDPVDGEIFKPVYITPAVTVNFDRDLYLLNTNNEKEIRVRVKSFTNNIEGKLKIFSDNSLKLVPSELPIKFDKRNQEKSFLIKVVAEKNENPIKLRANFEVEQKEFDKSIQTVNYKHIPQQILFSESSAKILLVDYKIDKTNSIGYIMGSGDDIPYYLSELGLDVKQLSDDDLESIDYNKFDVIITGIRAFNTREKLIYAKQKLAEFVFNGGTLISQYNTTGDLIIEPGIIPFKISRDRVTDENSAVNFLYPEHPALNSPFKISSNDFNNWVQERGLYFPNEWDSKLTSIFSMNDKNEPPKNGSILIANYGKGNYVYTGLSFFRQIPAGVKGAIKLFLNLISLKGN